jgi:hypothetical protein
MLKFYYIFIKATVYQSTANLFLGKELAYMKSTKDEYIYMVYDLIIRSSIMLPELNEYNGNRTVDVTLSESLASIKYKKNPDASIYIPVNDALELLITDGKDLTFYRLPSCSEIETRTYILGWGLGVILIQRNILPIHSSAVEKDGKCYLFIGESGAGKSTTAHGLLNRGFNFLSDDICAVTFDKEDKPVVSFGCRNSRLWEDSAVHLGYKLPPKPDTEEQSTKIRYSLLIRTKSFPQPLPLAGIYFINKSLPSSSKENILLSDLKGMEKFSALISNLYAPEAVKYLKKDIDYLNQCIKICSGVRFIKVNRIDAFLNPHLIADLIYKDIERNLKNAG